MLGGTFLSVVRRVGIGDGCALFDYGLGIGKELGAHCLPDCKEARGACHLFEIFNPHGVTRMQVPNADPLRRVVNRLYSSSSRSAISC